MDFLKNTNLGGPGDPPYKLFYAIKLKTCGRARVPAGRVWRVRNQISILPYNSLTVFTPPLIHANIPSYMKQKIIEPRTLKGFHDKLPAEALQKELLCEKLRNTFRLFGFLPIETPHLEYLETLLGGAEEGEISKQIFHWKDQGDRDVGLRFDLTVPLARFICQYRNYVGIPFKRYAIANVFRGEKPQAGRYREFTQCDFDTIGSMSVSADAEILKIVAKSLREIGVNNFAIRINHRRIMNGVAELIGASDIPGFLRIVDKLDKIGASGVIEELKKELNIGNDKAMQCLEIISQKRSPNAILTGLIEEFPNSSEIKAGVADLKEIFSILVDDPAFVLDLSIARGLGYYTGMVYETVLTDKPDLGSISSGGRYDNLTATFSKEVIPGVGGSIGLDRLLVYLTEKQAKTKQGILIMHEAHNSSAELFQAAEALRTRGISCEVYLSPDKMKKQFDYAEKRNYLNLLFIEADKTFRIRNTESRQETKFKTIGEISC